MDPLNVTFDLTNLQCLDEGDGPGNAEPYLWTVFFKIDGSTVSVNSKLMLEGSASVFSTPGNHGDLPNHDVAAGERVAIPRSLGHFQTRLLPIPVKPLPGRAVGGVVGSLAVLMEEDSTPDDAIASGHAALNKALRDQLDKLIPTLGISKQSPSDDDLKKLEDQISAAVTAAVSDNVSFWDAVWGVISFGNSQDDQVGTAKFFFSHDQLAASAGKPIPLQQHWTNEGDWILNGSVSVTKRLYDAVWRPGTSGEVQFYDQGHSDHQKHYDDLWPKNYRIALLNTYEVGA